MTAPQILDGTQIAKKYLECAAKEIEKLKPARLTLATVQVGASKDTELYFKYLEGLLGQIGIKLAAHSFTASAKEEEVIAEIVRLNRDPQVTGIMIFSPLPKTINAANLVHNIAMSKDVEGRTFMKSHFGVISPTANAVLTLLEATHCDIAGKEAVVIGHSDLVGKPTAILLMDKLATVTVCHVKTKDLAEHVRHADIVVAAVGKAHVVKGEWIKPGAIVIDVGENVVDGKLVGDVEFETAKKNAAFISPVPGGVGPVTNVMLIKNLILLNQLKARRNGNH